MAEQEKKRPEPAAEAEETCPAEAAGSAGTAEAAAEAAAEETVSKADLEAALAVMEKAKAEAAANRESLLRVSAEYDNFRKRTVKEKEALYADGFAAALTAVLPVIDNLERAVAFSDGDGLKKGLEQVMKQLADVLAKENVTVIDPLLKPFDPALHNAVMHEENDGYDENTVTEVLLKGYRIGDRVIRHAMVKVAN